ncbi:MAG: sulfur carrier protein ThiS, partial [Rhodospirillales bacterium]|nr:sulfur carrier protein ThiS [Rhodospirillales bacterium]
MEITVNGTERTVAPDLLLDDLLRDLGLDSRKIAVERNREIVRRAEFGTLKLRSGDSIEIVHLVGGGDDDRWEVAGRRFHSRLIIGTGKFATYAQNRAALEASGAEIITVAVRRVNLDDPNAERLTDVIDPKAYTYLPNTAGCYTADD